MTTSQKAAISLLIAVLIFGAFSFLAFTGLFDFLETRFYNPSASEEAFLSPAAMKIILLAAFFLTTYIIIFLLFNLRQDPLTVVQNRLRQLQISLIEQFYERKGEADWARWLRELENRREEIRAILKRGVKADSIKNADMDVLINKSWDELITMLGGRRDLQEESTAASHDKSVDEATEPPDALSPNVALGEVTGKTGLLKKAAAVASPIGAAEKIYLAPESCGSDEIEVLEELDETDKLEIAATDDESSQVESSTDIETETADDELFDEDLEIVSPFSAMVFDSSPTDDAGKEDVKEKQPKEEHDGELETDTVAGLPLITTPFSIMSSRARIETLEIYDEENENQTNFDIIKEREGVHYISEDALSPSPKFAATLNSEFKELVDEVTK